MARNRGLALFVSLLTCIATITAVRWLSTVIASEHGQHLPSTSLRHHERAQLGRLTQETYPAKKKVASMEPLQRTKPRQEAQPLKDPSLETRANSLPENLPLRPQKPQSKAAGLMGGGGGGNAGGEKSEMLQQCRQLKNTEFSWGDAVVWGSSNKKASAEECCKSCLDHKPATPDALTCTVWVWCGDKEKCGKQFQECWLKHLLHPGGSSPRQGPEIPWTSGGIGLPDPVDESIYYKPTGEDRSFHTLVTAQGAATHWQARVGYYWFKKAQKQCWAMGTCHMGGFTRLLHSGEADDLMEEIPTTVVNPLQDKDHKGYVVLNRPWAVVQWLRIANIPERYVLMSEPDHLWLKPMPNLMIGDKPASFPFFYIEPAKASNAPLVQKFTGKLSRQQLESISPIGNAPTMLALTDLHKVAETWMNTSHAIFDDDEAHKAWNWVLEMYGFTISCYIAGIQPADLHVKMMSQPPWDNDRPWGPKTYLLHYTYGMDYTLDGKHLPGEIGPWRFDKRTYGGLPPPRNLEPPPPKMENNLVRHLINAINEASEVIPGWPEYAKTGKAKELWDGKTFKDNPSMTSNYFS